ncbi:hypothetical protein E4T56_gene14190 [Termitomyces sp. T112]|nr:hypothetical protein E4T56_gene14190 [Termitomyces sp. T112]
MDSLRQPRSPFALTNDDIEAVIQAATSSHAALDARTAPSKDTRTQLFVGNLPYRVRWQDLKDLFRRAGTVLRADVSLGPDNRSRGYGTVLLATAEDAGRAIDLFNGYSWQNRILEVRPDRLPPDYDANHPPAIVSAPPLEEDGMEYSALLHHNFPLNLSLRSLFVGNDLFRRAGTIMRADVALGQDGRSRGFGTVTFATESDAERAVQMFNGYEYNGRTLKVNHDKFTQLNQLPIGVSLASSLASSLTPSPASISPSPSVRSAPGAACVSLPTATLYQTRHLSPLTSLTQSSSNTQLTVGYASHQLGNIATSTSCSPAPFDVWPQLQQEKPREEKERDLLKSFSGLDLRSDITRVASTMSSYSAPVPSSASRSTSTSSMKPPSIATTASTGSFTSSSSLAAVSSVSASTSGSSNDNSHLPLSFKRHRRLSATKEDSTSSLASASTNTTGDTAAPIATIPPPLKLRKLRSPPRHPGPIALPPPPHVASFAHLHQHPHSPHGILSFSPLHHPHSPLFPPATTHHGQQVEQIKQTHGHQQPHQVTPISLPLTPSMPPFTFLPPGPGPGPGSGSPNPSTSTTNPYSTYAQSLPSPIHMSPLHHPHAHILHPHPHAHIHPLASHPLQHSHSHSHPAPFGITPLSPSTSATAPVFTSATASASAFSPGATMSPGAFWGRPGHGPPPANPLINPAVGAPVHVSRPNANANAGVEPTGYFDGAWFVESRGMGEEQGSEQVVSEISKGKDGDHLDEDDEAEDDGEGAVLDGAVGIERRADGESMDSARMEVRQTVVNMKTERQVNGDGDGDGAHTDTEETQKQIIRPRPRRHSSTTTAPVLWKIPLPPKNEYREGNDVDASKGAVVD